MNNTDLLTTKTIDFQAKRTNLMKEYNEGIARIERYEGSIYHAEKKKALAEDCKNRLKALQDEYNKSVQVILNDMRKNNSARPEAPVTKDMINTLNALKLKTHVTEEDIAQASTVCRKNALAMSVIRETAKDAGIIHDIPSELGIKTDLTTAEVDRQITAIQQGLNDFMNYDTSMAARHLAERLKQIHGENSNRELPKRATITNKKELFNEVTYLLDSQYERFIEIVDGIDGAK